VSADHYLKRFAEESVHIAGALRIYSAKTTQQSQTDLHTGCGANLCVVDARARVTSSLDALSCLMSLRRDFDSSFT
jgi:hypothetical protein